MGAPLPLDRGPSTISRVDEVLNTIQCADCVEAMNRLPEGSIDLVFADPPFNIGYTYDVYEDSVEQQKYIDWSARWISAVLRVLKRNGTFWLAISDQKYRSLP
jgi:DNA modification methylase